MYADAPALANLFQLASSQWITQVIAVGAKLGLADLLEDGPRSAETLASATNTHAPSLQRLPRGLASLDLVAEQPDGTFMLTELGGRFRSGAPASLRAWAIMQGAEWNWRPWGALLHTVQTGQPAFEHLYGAARFGWFAAHPEAAADFDAAMTSLSSQDTSAVVDAYDFGAARRVVDVGGGAGVLLMGILRAYPRLAGVLFDRPPVIARVGPRFVEAGLADRSTLAGGDFLEAAPAGGDVYVLSKVLHDWDDAHARRILVSCRKAIGDTRPARLLIVDHILGEGTCPAEVAQVDLQMLVMYRGGRKRTLDEFRSRLAATEFRLLRTLPTTLAMSILEAAPA